MAPADEPSARGLNVRPYLTDMENSPGALSLSRTRKAPHSRCLSRLSATLRDIRPANQLEEEEEEEEERMRSSLNTGSRANLYPVTYNIDIRLNEEARS